MNLINLLIGHNLKNSQWGVLTCLASSLDLHSCWVISVDSKETVAKKADSKCPVTFTRAYSSRSSTLPSLHSSVWSIFFPRFTMFCEQQLWSQHIVKQHTVNQHASMLYKLWIPEHRLVDFLSRRSLCSKLDFHTAASALYRCHHILAGFQHSLSPYPFQPVEKRKKQWEHLSVLQYYMQYTGDMLR